MKGDQPFISVRTMYIATAFAVLIFIVLSNAAVVCAAGEVTPSNIELSELEETIDEYMEEYIGSTVNGAAIIYIHGGELAFSKGYGYADAENKIKVTPEKTVFEYASISKVFTWTAVMQLVEQGKINLNEDIMTYLPEEFNEKLKRKLRFDKPIRILDLMNHRAGFEDKYFNTDLTCEEALSDTLEDALIETMPDQVYKPDTVTAYSNYSACLAGYVVECVTKEKLYDYLKENIFDVTDMNTACANPRYDDIDYIVDNKAKGYYEGVTDSGWTYVNTYPDGSLNGSALDLAKFVMSYMKEDCPLFENQTTAKEMLSTSYKASENLTGCAHGFWEYDGAEVFYQHNGGQRGFTTMCAFSPLTKDGIVILTNTGDEQSMPYELLQLVLGDNSELNAKAGENLPDAFELDRMEFLSARRNYSDITSIGSYLEGNVKIETIDKNTIKCNRITYVQTAPYFYQMTNHGDNLIARGVYSTIYFFGEDGNVKGLSFGGMVGDDYLRSKIPYTNAGLLMQIVLGLCSGTVFLIAPIGILIRFLANRKKQINLSNEENHYYKFINRICFCGFFILVNLFVMVISIMSMVEFEDTNSINIQIGINYFLTIIFVLLIAFRVVYAKKNEKMIFFKKRHLIYVVAFAIITVLLIMWNYVSFI